MSNSSDLFGGGASGKPKRITVYTLGTGTYIPTEDMARCLVRVQAAGSNSAATIGGVGGAMVEDVIRVPIAGVPYSVGANGAPAAPSFVGEIRASAGAGPVGGLLGNGVATGTLNNIGGVRGVAGGGSGTGGVPGASSGFPAGGVDCAKNGYSTGAGSYAGGGDSFFGRGGNGASSGSGKNATGYGAGGGAGPGGAGLGSGGYIEIWDYGV